MELEEDKGKLLRGRPPGSGHPLTPHQLTQCSGSGGPETAGHAQSLTQILSVCKTCHLISNQAMLPGIREGRGFHHTHTHTHKTNPPDNTITTKLRPPKP